MRLAGALLVLAATVNVVWAMRGGGGVLNWTEADPPIRRRAFRQLLRAVGVWELTIAVFLLAIGGWTAVPNTIVLIATGVFVAFFPQLFDGSNT